MNIQYSIAIHIKDGHNSIFENHMGFFRQTPTEKTAVRNLAADSLATLLGWDGAFLDRHL